MKIVLIGFMGSGKTSVAPRLARRLGLQAVEMDDLIVERAGKSIADIFADGGEAAFRDLEAKVGQELRDCDDVVISTGGGVVTNDKLMAALAASAVVIHLAVPFKIALRRATSVGGNRPLLNDPAETQALYETRKPFYNKYAALHITTNDRSVDEVVEEIVRQVQNL